MPDHCTLRLIDMCAIHRSDILKQYLKKLKNNISQSQVDQFKKGVYRIALYCVIA